MVVVRASQKLELLKLWETKSVESLLLDLGVLCRQHFVRDRQRIQLKVWQEHQVLD